MPDNYDTWSELLEEACRAAEQRGGFIGDYCTAREMIERERGLRAVLERAFSSAAERHKRQVGKRLTGSWVELLLIDETDPGDLYCTAKILAFHAHGTTEVTQAISRLDLSIHRHPRMIFDYLWTAARATLDEVAERCATRPPILSGALVMGLTDNDLAKWIQDGAEQLAKRWGSAVAHEETPDALP